MNFNLDQINWEPIAYFFFHSSLIMAASAAVFFTLGLWFGYLTWARHKRRARAFQEECDLLRHEIASLKRRIVEETSAPAPNVAISADFSPPTVVPRSIAADAGLGGILGLPLEDEPKPANPAPSANAVTDPHRPHGPSPLAQLVKNATAPEPPKVSLPTVNRPPIKPTEASTEKPQSVTPPSQEQSIATPRPTPLSKPMGAPIIVSKLSVSSELPAEKKVVPPAPQAEPAQNQTPAATPSAPTEPKGGLVASAPSSQPPAALPPVPPPLAVSAAVASALFPAQPSPTLPPPPVSKPPLPAAAVLPAIPSLEVDPSAVTVAMVAPPILPTPLPIPAFTPPIAAEPKAAPAPAIGHVEPPTPPKSKTAPQSLPPKPLAPSDAPTESTALTPTTSVAAPALDPLARLAAVIAASKPVNTATAPQATTSQPSTKPPLASSEPLVADKLARLLGQAINPVAAAITPVAVVSPPPAESGPNLEPPTPPDSSPPAIPIPEVSKPVAPPVAEMPGSETPTAKADALPPALPVAPTPVPSTANPTTVSAFAGQLASGEATIDPVLGIIFHHRPDRWDDLTLLRGVAEILQNRLYEHGVFTFKQIALWSEANIREFSTLFGFKERINREKWCQQARDLHFLKYGEKI